MWAKQSIENEIDATLTQLDADSIPDEQVALLANFDLNYKGLITDGEKNKIDILLLSDNKDDVELGVKLLSNKLKRDGGRTLESIRKRKK